MEVGQEISVNPAVFAEYRQLVDEIQEQGPLALLFRGQELNIARFRLWQRVQKETGLDVIGKIFRADVEKSTVTYEGDKTPEAAEADAKAWEELTAECGDSEPFFGTPVTLH